MLADDEEVFEFANLAEEHTGITGTIYITSQRADSRPHVKWYPPRHRPGSRAPCLTVSIEDAPKTLANSLSATITGAVEKRVLRWVAANRERLEDFWHHGQTWPVRRVHAFCDSLTPVPRH